MPDRAQHVSAKPRSGLDEHSCEVMDAAPVMIWVSGADKLCTWFNKPWLDFTGRSLQQELGNGWAEGVHPIDLEHCLDIYIKQFDAREPFRMQYRLRGHDGNYRWIDDVGVPRRAPDGTFLGYWGSCTDVHEAAARLEGEIAVRIRTERDAKSSSQRGVLIDSIQDYAIYSMHITDYLIETADQCELIAKRGRMLLKQLEELGSKTTPSLAQISDGGEELSERVERIAQSLLAKAVEIDHEREKQVKKGQSEII